MKPTCTLSLNRNTDENSSMHVDQVPDQTHVDSVKPFKNNYLRMKYKMQILSALFFFTCMFNLMGQRPTAVITLDTTRGCEGLKVCYSAASSKAVSASQAITKYYWDFGDGDTSMRKTGCKNFNLSSLPASGWRIRLKVVDKKNIASYYVYKTVHVSKQPIASFTPAGPVVICDGSETIAFVNTSTSPSGHLFKKKSTWTFGDGTTSTLKNPSHLYNVKGDFFVNMTITDTNFCKSAATPIKVSVDNVTSTINGPDTVCANTPISFTSTTVGASIFIWNIEGLSYSGSTATHSFISPGPQDVILFALNADGSCSASPIHHLEVDMPTASGVTSTTWVCRMPETVSFFDNSSSISSIKKWNWSFYSGSEILGTSTLKDPIYIFNKKPPKGNSFLIAQLEVESKFGCKSDPSLPISIEYRYNEVSIYADTLEDRCIPTNDTGKLEIIKWVDAPFTKSRITQYWWEYYKQTSPNKMDMLILDTIHLVDSMDKKAFTLTTIDTVYNIFCIRDALCGVACSDTGKTFVVPGDTMTPNFMIDELKYADTTSIFDLCIGSKHYFRDTSKYYPGGGAEKPKPKYDERWSFHWYYGNGPEKDFLNPLYSNFRPNATKQDTTKWQTSYEYIKDTLIKGLDTLIYPLNSATNKHVYYYVRFNGCSSDTIFRRAKLNGPFGIFDSIVIDPASPYIYWFYAKVFNCNSVKLFFGDGKDTTISYGSVKVVDTIGKMKPTHTRISHKYAATKCNPAVSPGCGSLIDTVPYKNINMLVTNSMAPVSCNAYRDTLRIWNGSVLDTFELHVHAKITPTFTVHKNHHDSTITDKIYCDDTSFVLHSATSYSRNYYWKLKPSSDFSPKVLGGNSWNDVLETSLKDLPFKHIATGTTDSILERGIFSVTHTVEALAPAAYYKTDYKNASNRIRYVKDSVVKNNMLRIFKPYPHFKVNDFKACVRQELIFDTLKTSGSIPDTAYVHWTMNYNDGSANETHYLPYTNFKHKYQDRFYVVPTMNIKDVLGCEATRSLRKPFDTGDRLRLSNLDDTILVTKPYTNFMIDTNSYYRNHLCQNDTVREFNDYTTLWPISPDNIKDTLYLKKRYTWMFGDGSGDTSNAEVPKKLYPGYGQRFISLKVTYINIGQCDSTIGDIFTVHPQPHPRVFSTDTIVACYPTPSLLFQNLTYSKDIVDSCSWEFGDNTSPLIISSTNNVFHSFAVAGKYNIWLRAMTKYGCWKDTIQNKYIKVRGPEVAITAPTAICKQDSAAFTFTQYGKINNMSWYFDVDSDFNPLNKERDTMYVPFWNPAKLTFKHKYDTAYNHAWYIAISDSFGCTVYYPSDQPGVASSLWPPKPGNVYVYPLEAAFIQLDTACGAGDTVHFANTSPGVDNSEWYFENDFGIFDPAVIKSGGDTTAEYSFNLYKKYQVKLIVTDFNGCFDQVSKFIRVHPAPPISVSVLNSLVCPDASDSLFANYDVGYRYQWSPSNLFSNSTAARTTARVPSVTDFMLTLTNDTTSCYSKDTVRVNTQGYVDIAFLAFKNGERVDPKVNMGDSVLLLTYINAAGVPIDDLITSLPIKTYRNYVIAYAISNQRVDTIQWENAFTTADGRVLLQPTQTADYKAYATDTLGCKASEAFLTIDVAAGTAVMASAFTPNGDGINDVLRVQGRGIKQLIKFSIYNRWGQLMFETADINIGWDGNYQGKLQVIDSYIYNIEVESLDGTVVKREGSFSLLR